MKTRLTLTLLALAAVSINLHAASSVLPAPLPDFMNQEQLAKWNADQATAQTTASTAPESSTQFYTGKPYVADAGGYVFKYRTYNPEMSRWTSADPSGFPDGANNRLYTDTPTIMLDPDGLLTVIGTTTPSSPSQTYTPTPGGPTYTVTAENVGIFSSSNSLSGTLDITDYLAIGATGGLGGDSIAISVSGVPSQTNITYKWIQVITTSDPLNGRTSPYLDNNGGSTPFYPDATSTYFSDGPTRSFTDATQGNPVTWESVLQYVGVNSVTGAITNYGGITYGFTITE